MRRRLSQLTVAVPLNAKGRSLIARPGGARIAFTTVLTQADHKARAGPGSGDERLYPAGRGPSVDVNISGVVHQEPTGKNDTEANRAGNRRVNVTIIN